MKPLNEFSRGERAVVAVAGLWFFGISLISFIETFRAYNTSYLFAERFFDALTDALMLGAMPAIVLGGLGLWVLAAPKKDDRDNGE